MNLLIKQKHTDLDKEFMFTRGKGGGKKTWHLIINYDTISL